MKEWVGITIIRVEKEAEAEWLMASALVKLLSLPQWLLRAGACPTCFKIFTLLLPISGYQSPTCVSLVITYPFYVFTPFYINPVTIKGKFLQSHPGLSLKAPDHRLHFFPVCHDQTPGFGWLSMALQECHVFLSKTYEYNKSFNFTCLSKFNSTALLKQSSEIPQRGLISPFVTQYWTLLCK